MNDICYRRFNNKLSSVKPFIEFVVKDLKLKQHIPLTIQIDFYDFWDNELDGRTMHQEDDYTLIKIELNTDRINRWDYRQELRDTIAHELRHVWQKVNNESKNIIVLSTKLGYTSKQYDEYLNSPNEADAIKYAKKLVSKWDKRRR